MEGERERNEVGVLGMEDPDPKDDAWCKGYGSLAYRCAFNRGELPAETGLIADLGRLGVDEEW